MILSMNYIETMAAHPGPWRYLTLGGNVQMFDAKRVEVPLFTILNLAVTVSKASATQQAQASNDKNPA